MRRLSVSSFLILLLIMISAACAPPSAATPQSTPVFTNTPPPTITPQPTQTLEPTATPITVTETSLDSCTRIMEAKISGAGILEVLYMDDNGFPPSTPLSSFGYAESHTKLWLWSDSTQVAVPFPVPPNVLAPKLSSNHGRILFRRDSGENQSELWVINADGQNEKRLATVRLNEEMKAKYPDGFFSLDYGWIPNTDKFFYEIDVTYGQIPPLIINKFVLVDANSGKAIPVSIPSDTQTFSFAPDGSQMAILMESGLHVLSTKDGRTQFTIQASLNEPTYSPDGKYIIDFIDGGILLINAQTGQQQTIPLKYTIMSSRTEGPAYGPLPDFTWVNRATLLLTSLNSDKGYVFLVPFFFTPDPSWTFTVWQIDLANGTTHPIQTFSGDPASASISPDKKWVAFLKHEGQTTDLYLADLVTGKILENIKDGEFRGWFPDSRKYLYTVSIPYTTPEIVGEKIVKADLKYYLGQVGEAPIPWSSSISGWSQEQWVDDHRLAMDCKIITFP